MREVYIELGAIVRECRTRQGMTQLDLARRLGYDSTQFVSLFERGMSKVPVNTLGQLIVILGIPEKKIIKILMSAYEEDLVSNISKGKAAALNKVG